jgi:intracellular septation protein
MKIFLDFIPILLFFIAYKQYDLYVATAVVIVASVIQAIVIYIIEKRIPNMLLASTALVVLLGGATLILQDESFIKWKPTIVNWLFATVFIGSLYIGKSPLLERMMQSSFPTLPRAIWIRMTWVWASFFIAIGILNLWVAFNFDTDTWVNFKLIGLMGLLLAFIIAQSFYLYRVAQDYPETDNASLETNVTSEMITDIAKPIASSADSQGNHSQTNPTTKDH